MLNRFWGRHGPAIEAEAELEVEGVFETMRSLEPARPRWPALRLAAIDSAAVVRALPIVGVLLIALALNWPTLTDYFHGDDFVAFTELGTKKPLDYLYDAFFFKDVNFYWRPLGQASYLGLYEVFGLDPAAFHALSIAMFLATIWLLYRFCLNAGFSRWVATGSAALFAVLPSHVVSVAWVTNSPRVMAVMFFMGCLVVLQKALEKKSFSLEVLAWLLFLLCPLADETSMALAPIPVLYSAVYSGRLKIGWPVVARLVFYAAVVAALAPLQFMYTLDDEPRLADYSFGPHVLSQTWALTSQMVLPLATGSPLALSFQAIGPVQWVAGALAIVGGGLLLMFGTWKMRLLAVWTAAALAPFTLWDIEWLSPRYVYMAAIPYSIILAWLLNGLLDVLRSYRPLRVAVAGGLVLATVGAGAVSAQATLDRNDDWAASTESFRILAQGLPEAVPEIPPKSRIVIYYGIWQDFPLWPRVVVRTIYKDESIDVISIDRRNVDASLPRREARDIVVYYSDGHFLRVAPFALKP
jgi:hypothetical protein